MYKKCLTATVKRVFEKFVILAVETKFYNKLSVLPLVEGIELFFF